MPPPDFKTAIETIRDHNEITDVIGSFVQLKRAGNSLKACCPFHKEKTPSFHVNPSRQSFHCFGCGAGGDVFNFIMRHENMEFMQAAKFLADRANLAFEFDRESSGGSPSSQREELLRLHVQLRDWYQRCLKESTQAEKARQYLTERDLNDEAISAFGIGFAPARDTNWIKWAASRKFDIALLVTAGVLIRNDDGGWYDRFNDRLMFPIQDESGRVIGFSGRLLPGDTRNSKYVNSPETPLFTKSKVIYALYHAKREILDKNEAILCEGQIDVIRCHLAGIKNAVAAQGTAITDDHARILRRFTDSVRLVLDSDDAGKNAAMRSAEVLISAGLNVNVASLPPGDDPDSLIRRDGGDTFLTLVEAAVPSLEFQIDTLMSREKTEDDAATLRVSRIVLESIARVSSEIQRDQLIHLASTRLGKHPDRLRDELRGIMRKHFRAPSSNEEPVDAPAPPTHPREELEVVRLLMHFPESADKLMMYVETSHFSSATCRKLYELLTKHAFDEHFDIMAELPADEAEARRVVAMLTAEDRFVGTEFNIEKAAPEIIVGIRKRDFDQQRRRLEARRRNAEGDEARQLDLEITELIYHQHTLRSGWDKAKQMLDLHRDLSDSQT